MSFFKTQTTAFFWIVIAVLLSFILYAILMFLPKNNFYNLFLVQSGSMEPSIATGDLIVIKKQSAYAPRDTITFFGSDDRVVTHRVIEVNTNIDKLEYVTKGDANPSLDIDVISQENVLGKVVLVVPKLGFLTSFATTKVGFLVLIGLPFMIIIYSEYQNIRRLSNVKK